MIHYIIRRLGLCIVLILFVTLIVFLCMHLLPGDPIMVYMSVEELQGLSPEELIQLRHELGLDRSLVVQYLSWLKTLCQGDLGSSLLLGESVSSLVFDRLPVTMYLGVLALALSAVVGVGLGVLAAVKRGTWIDTVVTILANVGITVPLFWLGVLLIYAFSLKLGWLPTSGYISPFDDLWMSIRSAVMPVICLAVGPTAGLARQSRSAMLEVIGQDYVRTAWAKGLSERLVIARHAVRNALVPVTTYMGVFLAHIFGGSVVVETVFNVPGMGRLVVNAILQQDFQIVQGAVLVVGAIVVFINLLVDISYAWLDPRIRYS